MQEESNNISRLADLNKFRSAPKLNKKQCEMLFKQIEDIISEADWLTIGVMSPTINQGINAVRKIEQKFRYNKMKCITLPKENGPIFLKANQKTGEIHSRIEYGLGEGILISCHKYDNTENARTIGPLPLEFFN